MSETTQAPVSEYLAYSPATRWIIMGAVMLGTVMQMIDTSIVNVAIPTMMGNLGASLDEINWVSTGYILASVIILPLTGWLATLFGRRRYLAGSIALFTVASVLCGMSQTLGFLIFSRVLQGVGGAALISTAQATMMEIFPPEQLGMVQSLYGLGVIVGPAIGPTLGGWIVDNLNWHWIFYINLPIGIVATIFCWLFMRDSRYKRHVAGHIDFFGILLLAIGLGSLQMVLDKGQRENWFQSPLICWLTFSAVVGLVAFVVWELTIEHPVINLRVLRHRSFAVGVIFGTMLGFGLFGGIFILPVYLQQAQHYTPLQTGILMLPGALATGIIMPLVGGMIGKYSSRMLIFLGVVGISVSMLMLHTMTLDTGPTELIVSLVLRGLAMGFLWSPLTIVSLIVLKGHEIAEGTALFNLSRQLGGSAGIAFLSTYLTARIDFHTESAARASLDLPAHRATAAGRAACHADASWRFLARRLSAGARPAGWRRARAGRDPLL